MTAHLRLTAEEREAALGAIRLGLSVGATTDEIRTVLAKLGLASQPARTGTLPCGHDASNLIRNSASTRGTRCVQCRRDGDTRRRRAGAA